MKLDSISVVLVFVRGRLRALAQNNSLNACWSVSSWWPDASLLQRETGSVSFGSFDAFTNV